MQSTTVPAESSSAALIILSAPSGAGKTTLARKVLLALGKLGRQAAFSVSYTTRPPRPGEVDGRDYHFVTEQAFSRMVDEGQMLEHAQVFGACYGTGRQATLNALAQGQTVFLDIDWQGARQVKRSSPQACTAVFILPPSREALRQRLQGRGQDSAAVIETRMNQAVAEMSHYPEFDYVVVNDDLERASEALLQICLGAVPPDCRAEQHRDLLAELLGEKVGPTR